MIIHLSVLLRRLLGPINYLATGWDLWSFTTVSTHKQRSDLWNLCSRCYGPPPSTQRNRRPLGLRFKLWVRVRKKTNVCYGRWQVPEPAPRWSARGGRWSYPAQLSLPRAAPTLDFPRRPATLSRQHCLHCHAVVVMLTYDISTYLPPLPRKHCTDCHAVSIMMTHAVSRSPCPVFLLS